MVTTSKSVVVYNVLFDCLGVEKEMVDTPYLSVPFS